MEQERKRPMRQTVEIKPAGEPREYVDDGRAVTFVPLSIKRRQTRKLLIPPPGSSQPALHESFDLPLIKTLGKAFYWQGLIDSGDVADAAEIARRFKINRGWVNEVLRMTQLAPDIVEAILAGRQPRHLNLQAVRGRNTDIPVLWDEQKRRLEFE